MRRQLLYCLVAFVIAAPLLLMAESSDGTLRPVWARERAAPQAQGVEPAMVPPPGVSWVVSGAGDPGYNGAYRFEGTCNGFPCYEKDRGHWLFWAREPGYPAWVLAPSPGRTPPVYYGNFQSPLPAAPWNAVPGTRTPAPGLAVGATEWPQYAVTGAGDPAYDGTYCSAGTYNGHPCFRKDSVHWLYWLHAAGPPEIAVWALGPSPGRQPSYSADPCNRDLPAEPWVAHDAAGSAPTVKQLPASGPRALPSPGSRERAERAPAAMRGG